MKGGQRVSTAFARIREKDRQDEPFVPTHVPAFPANNARPVANELRTYATLAEFASHVGLSVEAIEELVQAGHLKHVLICRDGKMLNAQKSLRDLEEIEQVAGLLPTGT